MSATKKLQRRHYRKAKKKCMEKKAFTLLEGLMALLAAGYGANTGAAYAGPERAGLGAALGTVGGPAGLIGGMHAGAQVGKRFGPQGVLWGSLAGSFLGAKHVPQALGSLVRKRSHDA